MVDCGSKFEVRIRTQLNIFGKNDVFIFASMEVAKCHGPWRSQD